eukprot:CAMPEP_0173275460 /NCGR_PEP_ID=MMETSP1143-20121109/2992_1 /TAXON_ID=483371 /ORGANISM="non described non described, Strain CCMP2298" /LENGTH=463 /DNA_ID=CAMNT_0014212353 /DNA_START=347 /DNA_END=1735 /DNA_ORIENTATION=+
MKKKLFQEEEEEKVLSTEREWNTQDFAGQYHYSRFQNKSTPLPGTQVKLERDYALALEQAAQKDVSDRAKRDQKTAEKLRVKAESAQLNTRIYFDTIVGAPIAAAEQVLLDREAIVEPVYPDSAKDIRTFMKNLSLGRHHYVGFAASNGFRSINFQDTAWGNSALHLAVKRGHLEACEELLKYKIDFDLINKLGNRPIHEAWFFWKTHYNRTREERQAQEGLTCDMLQQLLSYGTFADAQDQNGATHCVSPGPPQGSADPAELQGGREADQQGRPDGCADSPPVRARGVLQAADLLGFISHEMVRIDFNLIWRRFLQDYQAVISASKSAETIIAEIGMSSSVSRMELGGSGIRIDDPLLRAAFAATKGDVLKPKPWEPEWKIFVKHSQAAGVVDLKTELEELQKMKMGLRVKKKVHVYRPVEDREKPDKAVPQARPRLLVQTQTQTRTQTQTDAHMKSGESRT